MTVVKGEQNTAQLLSAPISFSAAFTGKKTPHSDPATTETTTFLHTNTHTPPDTHTHASRHTHTPPDTHTHTDMQPYDCMPK